MFEIVPWKGTALEIQRCRCDTPLAPMERIRAEPKFGLWRHHHHANEAGAVQDTAGDIGGEGRRIKEEPNSTTTLMSLYSSWSTMADVEKCKKEKKKHDISTSREVHVPRSSYCGYTPRVLKVNPHA